MSSNHHHMHNHSESNTSATRLFITMALNFLITLFEIIGGILSGSLSLISDALHNFSDGIAILISYIAIKLGARPVTEQYTFGLKRAEIFAAVINSGTLIAICLYLFKEAYNRLTTPEPISGGMMIIVASIGLLANVIGAALLRKGSQKNINIRSAYLHLISDVASSVAVIIGGIFIYFYSIYWIDPLLTVLISIWVLKESFEILKDATNVLMMGTPKNASMVNIQKELEAVKGVKNIHHVHIWRLNEQTIHFEAHIEVDEMPVTETTKLGTIIEEKLNKKYQINHVTLQFECDKCDPKTLISS